MSDIEEEEEVSGEEGDEEEDTVEGEDVVPDLPVSERTARTLETFSIGRIAESSKEALSKQLAVRMDPTKFKERFATVESQGERNLNRTTQQLGALLANRSSVQRLQGLGILREGSGKLQASQAALKREQTRDNLSALLGARQSKENLVSKGILLAEDNDEKKRLGEAKKLLSSFLLARPDQEDLTRKNILKAESQERESKEAKQVLGDFFSVKRAPPTRIVIVPSGNQLVPHTVPKLSGIKAVSCGWGHTAALDAEGRVWVFGDSTDGRLGLGDITERPEGPVVNHFLQKLGAVSSICCGDHHTAAIIQGRLYTWGMGAWGRLGVGSQEDLLTPHPVKLEESVSQVACGAYHTLALTESGKVWGFGWNKNGRVGAGTELEPAVVCPVQCVFPEGVRVASVCCGQDASFAVTESGDVYSWGSGASGALGHADTADSAVPRRVESLQNVRIVAAGALFAVALTWDGRLLSWGLNRDSQLGRASSTSLAPAVVDSLHDIEGVACGKQHVLVVNKEGTCFSWGRGSNGILGHDSEENESLPKQLMGLKGCKQLSASWTHSAVVMVDGSLRTFGSGQHGKLGFVPSAPSSMSPRNLTTPTKILRKASF